MSLHETMTYPIPPAAVHAMKCDPEFHREVSAAVGALDTHVDVDGPTVVTRRTLETSRAPEAVRRIVGATVLVTVTTRWADADAGHRATLDLAVDGVPLTGTGSMTLTPQGGGTLETAQVDLRCRIPLVGGRIVEAARPLVQAALRAEQEVGRRRAG